MITTVSRQVRKGASASGPALRVRTSAGAYECRPALRLHCAPRLEPSAFTALTREREPAAAEVTKTATLSRELC